MIDPLPPRMVPVPFTTSTPIGDSLVNVIAKDELSEDDLWRIQHTCTFRIWAHRSKAANYSAELDAIKYQADNLGAQLEASQQAVANFKRALHDMEVTNSTLRQELAAYKAALGSENKQ